MGKRKKEDLIRLIGIWRRLSGPQEWIDELNNELKLLIEQERLEEKAAVIIQACLRTTVVRVKLDRAAKEETNHHRIHKLETEVHNIGTEMNDTLEWSDGAVYYYVGCPELLMAELIYKAQC